MKKTFDTPLTYWEAVTLYKLNKIKKEALNGQMKEGYHYPPRCQFKAL